MLLHLLHEKHLEILFSFLYLQNSRICENNGLEHSMCSFPAPAIPTWSHFCFILSHSDYFETIVHNHTYFMTCLKCKTLKPKHNVAGRNNSKMTSKIPGPWAVPIFSSLLIKHQFRCYFERIFSDYWNKILTSSLGCPQSLVFWSHDYWDGGIS